MKNHNSVLFVPATEKMLPKIQDCKADVVIVDLEDAILDSDKDAALERLKKYLILNESNSDLWNKDIYVRINPERCEKEIAEMNETRIVGYMIPKTESPKQLAEFHKLAENKQIIALVETAMGIVNAEEIAGSEHSDMLAFGAEDYTTQCGIKNEPKYLMYAKSKLVASAKACGKLIFDAMSLNIRNKETYKLEAVESKNLGFDGKLAIHPMQVEIINEVFRAYRDEYIKHIIQEYEKRGEAVVEIDGVVYEKPHIEALRRRLACHLAQK